MTPQQYRSEWTKDGDRLSPLKRGRIITLGLQPPTLAYLEMGLPIDASPYIDFVNDSEKPCTGISRLTECYTFLDTEFSKYINIGSDNSGNPFVINTANNDAIEWLDHEDGFSKIGHVNTSIGTFVQFLIIYREFVATTRSAYGSRAYVDGKFTNEEVEAMRLKMHATDKDALVSRGFWQGELKALLK